MELDKWLFCYLLQQSEHYRLIPLAKRLSATGDGAAYVYLSVCLLIFHPQGTTFFNQMLMGFILELPLYLLLKNTLRRPRPCHVMAHIAFNFEPSDKFSLPSGHTAAAFMTASIISANFPAIGVWVFIWATGVGLSRIALGVHYPLDILAGIALGIGSAQLVKDIV